MSGWPDRQMGEQMDKWIDGELCMEVGWVGG